MVSCRTHQPPVVCSIVGLITPKAQDGCFPNLVNASVMVELYVDVSGNGSVMGLVSL